jgi:ABC-type phosphate transport system substrate-binding protein
MKRYSRIIAALVAAGALCAASDAIAADCNFTGTTVYVTGSSASSPYLAALSTVLAAQTPPVTLVYIKTESCQGVSAFLAGTGASPVQLTSSATYWTPNPDGGAGIVADTCNFDATSTPAGGVYPDASVSDVFYDTCSGGTALASGFNEVGGPIQAMTFIVNANSTQTSISGKAAHVVFKDIGITADQITPWTDPNQLFIRAGGPLGSGTRAMTSAAMGFTSVSDWSSAIPSGQDGGPNNVEANSTAMLSAVAGDTAQANETLGILSATTTDPNRPGSSSTTPVKVLAFQSDQVADQTCGYFPDSTANTFDKLNVRQGRYDIWGPLHFITAVSGGVPVSTSNPTDAPTNAAVAELVNLVSLPAGTTILTLAQKTSVIQAAATAHVVAQCAMQVSRTTEVGPPVSSVPPEPCGCYWESLATGGTTTSTCTECTTDTDCGDSATPTCRYGFCEVQ